MADFELTGEAASTVARMLAMTRLDRIRSVIVTSHGARGGTVEFVELTVEPRDGEPAPEVPAGFIVTSYVVADLAKAYEELVGDGFEPLCPPSPLDIGGMSVTVASLRGPHPGVIELIAAH